MLKGLLILGYGGHARSVGDVALASGIRELLFVDEFAEDGEMFMGFPVVKRLPSILQCKWKAFSAAGNNALRKKHIDVIKYNHWELHSVIAPTANLCHGAIIGQGVFVAHNAHIGAMTQIEDGAIINTGAVVDHEAVVGRYCHVSINSTIAGRSTLGEMSFLGANAVIIDKINVSKNVTIGAGACVIANIVEEGIYAGVPAKKIQPR